MERTLSLSSMATIFVMEKIESSLENLKTHGIIEENDDSKRIVLRIIKDIRQLREKVLENG